MYCPFCTFWYPIEILLHSLYMLQLSWGYKLLFNENKKSVSTSFFGRFWAYPEKLTSDILEAALFSPSISSIKIVADIFINEKSSETKKDTICFRFSQLTRCAPVGHRTHIESRLKVRDSFLFHCCSIHSK